jgi:hypothetical protein
MCNLTRLISTLEHGINVLDSPTTISWNDFTTLATTAGSTLQEFTGFAFTFPRDATTLSPAVFKHFVALRKFTWKCRFRSEKLTFGVDEVSTVALPALEFLDVRTPEILSVLARMKFVFISSLCYPIHTYFFFFVNTDFRPSKALRLKTIPD